MTARSDWRLGAALQSIPPKGLAVGSFLMEFDGQVGGSLVAQLSRGKQKECARRTGRVLGTPLIAFPVFRRLRLCCLCRR